MAWLGPYQRLSFASHQQHGSQRPREAIVPDAASSQGPLPPPLLIGLTLVAALIAAFSYVVLGPTALEAEPESGAVLPNLRSEQRFAARRAGPRARAFAEAASGSNSNAASPRRMIPSRPAVIRTSTSVHYLSLRSGL